MTEEMRKIYNKMFYGASGLQQQYIHIPSSDPLQSYRETAVDTMFRMMGKQTVVGESKEEDQLILLLEEEEEDV